MRIQRKWGKLMNENDLIEFLDILYPHIRKRLETDYIFKNNVKIKNAEVVKVYDNNTVDIKFPYDKVAINVLNKTSDELKPGNTVCVMYWVDLKNAVVIFRVDS